MRDYVFVIKMEKISNIVIFSDIMLTLLTFPIALLVDTYNLTDNNEIEELDCTIANNNYLMWDWDEDGIDARPNILKIEFDTNCNLKSIARWLEDDNAFELLYFRMEYLRE